MGRPGGGSTFDARAPTRRCPGRSGRGWCRIGSAPERAARGREPRDRAPGGTRAPRGRSSRGPGLRARLPADDADADRPGHPRRIDPCPLVEGARRSRARRARRADGRPARGPGRGCVREARGRRPGRRGPPAAAPADRGSDQRRDRGGAAARRGGRRPGAQVDARQLRGRARGHHRELRGHPVRPERQRVRRRVHASRRGRATAALARQHQQPGRPRAG